MLEDELENDLEQLSDGEVDFDFDLVDMQQLKHRDVYEEVNFENELAALASYAPSLRGLEIDVGDKKMLLSMPNPSNQLLHGVAQEYNAYKIEINDNHLRLEINELLQDMIYSMERLHELTVIEVNNIVPNLQFKIVEVPSIVNNLFEVHDDSDVIPTINISTINENVNVYDPTDTLSKTFSIDLQQINRNKEFELLDSELKMNASKIQQELEFDILMRQARKDKRLEEIEKLKKIKNAVSL